jgi:hypothetical protein
MNRKKGRGKTFNIEHCTSNVRKKGRGKGKQELRVHMEQASYESCTISLTSIVLVG